jgi:hypothetical protein
MTSSLPQTFEHFLARPDAVNRELRRIRRKEIAVLVITAVTVWAYAGFVLFTG